MIDKKLYQDWLAKIQLNGSLINEIPSQLKESKKHYIRLCIAAVSQNPRVMKLVDDSVFLDEEFDLICDAAAIESKFRIWSAKIKISAVQIDNVPRELRHSHSHYSQLCKLAVKQEGQILSILERKLMDDEAYFEVCKLSIKQDPNNLQFVDQHFFKANAVRVLEMTLRSQYKYNKSKSDDRYQLSFEHCAKLFRKSNSSDLLSLIDAKFYTQEEYLSLCVSAVEKNIDALQFIDRSALTEEGYVSVAMTAVQQSKDALPLIDKSISDYAEIQKEHERCHSPRLSGQEISDLTEAVRKDGTKIKDVRLRLRESRDHYIPLCKEAVNQNTQALAFVDATVMRDNEYIEICEEAFKSNPASYEYVSNDIPLHPKFKIQEKLLHIQHDYNKDKDKNDRYKMPYSVCEDLLKYYDPKHDGATIALIDATLYSSKQYLKLCELAVAVNPLALNHVDWAAMTDPEAYQKVALKSVTANYDMPLDHIKLALNTIDKTKVNFDEILIRAVQTHPDALGIIDRKYHTDEIYDQAVKHHGVALEYIPQDQRTFERCLTAVLDNGGALAFVPESLRERVIDRVTPEKILATNFAAYRYLVKNEKYNQSIQQFLSTIQHVIVTQDCEYDDDTASYDIPFDYYEKDAETKDSFFIYTNSPRRQGKSIRVGSSSLNRLLDHLQKLNIQQPVNLVFLGHSTVESDEIAGFLHYKIAAYARDYPFINRITLLGCYTAEMLASQDEKVARQRMVESDVMASTKISTFAIMTHTPTDNEINKMFAGKFKSVNEAYVLIKTGKGEDESYRLIKVAINQNGEKVKLLEKELTNDAVDKLIIQINQNKPFQFPSARASDQIRYIKLPPPQSPLSAAELAFLNDEILLGTQRFDKRHPDYQTDKATHAFLTGANLRDDQSGLIQESLTASVIKELRHLQLDREVTVKGYPGVISVDNDERKFHTTRVPVYKKSYKTIGHFSGQKNVKKKLVEAERHKREVDEKTRHRSVRMTLGPKRK